jgi:hypothetical protein
LGITLVARRWRAMIALGRQGRMFLREHCDECSRGNISTNVPAGTFVMNVPVEHYATMFPWNIVTECYRGNIRKIIRELWRITGGQMLSLATLSIYLSVSCINRHELLINLPLVCIHGSEIYEYHNENPVKRSRECD